LSYSDAISFIESSKKYGSKPGLERITRLCSMAGDPQDGVPAVHVAGTNGKGSTSAMIASILSAAGYKTGLYISPYVEDVCECAQINGVSITHREFAFIAADIRKWAEQMAGEGAPPTEFEIETAIAFLWFRRSGCDIAVIETGLGGRLDATNVIKQPLVSVLTSISLDHTSILGGTISEIATEKCGILKPGDITVSYPLQPPDAQAVIAEYARKTENTLVLPDAGRIRFSHAGLDGTGIIYKGLNLHIPFIGRHQAYNAVTAVETALALRERRGFVLSDGNIADGIKNAWIPLRQEAVCRNPIILLDGAHNPDGLAALADTMKSGLAGRRLAVVMGMLADKEYQKSIALIAPLCGRFIASKPANPRALPSKAAADCAKPFCDDVSVEDNHFKALTEAVLYAGRDGAVVVCGSLYLAGQVRRAFFEDLQKFER